MYDYNYSYDTQSVLSRPCNKICNKVSMMEEGSVTAADADSPGHSLAFKPSERVSG